MNRKVIVSSMIRSIGHDAEKEILEIEFNSGAVWQYLDFPEAMWHQFDGSDSQGRFFNREIKHQYSEFRV